MTYNVDIARSGAFFALIFAQLIHVFECKSEEKGLFSIPFFNNMKLIGATFVSLIILLATLYIPHLNLIFSTVPLTLTQVFVPILYCMLAPIVISIFSKK